MEMNKLSNNQFFQKQLTYIYRKSKNQILENIKESESVSSSDWDSDKGKNDLTNGSCRGENEFASAKSLSGQDLPESVVPNNLTKS